MFEKVSFQITFNSFVFRFIQGDFFLPFVLKLQVKNSPWASSG